MDRQEIKSKIIKDLAKHPPHKVSIKDQQLPQFSTQR